MKANIDTILSDAPKTGKKSSVPPTNASELMTVNTTTLPTLSTPAGRCRSSVRGLIAYVKKHVEATGVGRRPPMGDGASYVYLGAFVSPEEVIDLFRTGLRPGRSHREQPVRGARCLRHQNPDRLPSHHHRYGECG